MITFLIQEADISHTTRHGQACAAVNCTVTLNTTSSWQRGEIFASGLQKVKISAGTFPSGGSCKCQGELHFQQLPRTDFHSQNHLCLVCCWKNIIKETWLSAWGDFWMNTEAGKQGTANKIFTSVIFCVWIKRTPRAGTDHTYLKAGDWKFEMLTWHLW